MKKFIKNKKKYIPIIVIALTIITLLGGTYAIFARIDEAKVANLYTTGNLQIELDDTTQGLGGIIDVVGVPTSDTDGANTNPYKFKLTNIGNLSYEFDIKLLSDATYISEHGCTDNQLPGNYIKVKFNDETPVLLSSLTDSIVKSTITLKPKESVIYELRVWLDEDTPNAQRGKHFHGKIVTDGHAITTQEANAPDLASGMIPIKYDETNQKWVKADYLNANNEWYDYNNEMWANAVLVNTAADTNVTGSKSRLEYMESTPGTEVLESDILAYYVWIPRYKYQLFNPTYASGTSPQEIQIAFEQGTATTGTVSCSYAANGTETCTNKAIGNWYTHPAFWWDNDNDGVRDVGEELKGIWVGKFETSSDTSCVATNDVAVGNGCNLTTISPRVKPGVTSWRGVSISTFYNSAPKISTTAYLTQTGVDQVDSHMMKNIEWGVVSYLLHSKYGKNDQIDINNNGSTYYTGGGIGNSYATNVGQSTTGNITGIYDMSGNAHDYVMGNYNNLPLNSRFSVETLSAIPNKYIDRYQNPSNVNTDFSGSHLGDATGEIAGWYGSTSLFAFSEVPWFIRGESIHNGSYTGVFGLNHYFGDANTNCAFRLVMTNVD